MKANELRLGNYVNYQGRAQKIHSLNMSQIRLGEIAYDDYSASVYNDNIKPIPLTEKWLLDFGFEKWTWCDDCAFIPLFFGDSLYCRYYNNLWHVKRMKIGRDSKGVFGKSEGKYLLPKGKIKYVHQLQNLYFALTNKELTIK